MRLGTLLPCLLLLAGLGPAWAATPTPPAPAAPASTQQVLRVGVEGAYPPFSEMTPDGRIRGFDVDIANALCEELRARCHLIQLPFNQLQPSLADRRTDLVVASLSMTEERRGRVSFTDKYYQVPAKFLGRRGETRDFEDAAMRDVAIGVLDGSMHANYLTDRYGGIAHILRYPTLEDAIEGLRDKKVDLVFGDALALQLGFLNGEEGRDLAFVGPDYTDTDWLGEGIAIAVSKENAALRDRLNKALHRLRTTGRYRTIANRYFAFDIYGGTPPAPKPAKVAAPAERRNTLPRLIDGTTGTQR
jgi:arginine/ornithine transport system substrate-binding protein